MYRQGMEFGVQDEIKVMNCSDQLELTEVDACHAQEKRSWFYGIEMKIHRSIPVKGEQAGNTKSVEKHVQIHSIQCQSGKVWD